MVFQSGIVHSFVKDAFWIGDHLICLHWGAQISVYFLCHASGGSLLLRDSFAFTPYKWSICAAQLSENLFLLHGMKEQKLQLVELQLETSKLNFTTTLWEFPIHCGGADSLLRISNGTIVSGHANGFVNIWKCNDDQNAPVPLTVELSHIPTESNSKLICIRCLESYNEKMFFAGSESGMIYLLDIQGNQLRRFWSSTKLGINSLSFKDRFLLIGVCKDIEEDYNTVFFEMTDEKSYLFTRRAAFFFGDSASSAKFIYQVKMLSTDLFLASCGNGALVLNKVKDPPEIIQQLLPTCEGGLALALPVQQSKPFLAAVSQDLKLISMNNYP